MDLDIYMTNLGTIRLSWHWHHLPFDLFVCLTSHPTQPLPDPSPIFGLCPPAIPLRPLPRRPFTLFVATQPNHQRKAPPVERLWAPTERQHFWVDNKIPMELAHRREGRRIFSAYQGESSWLFANLFLNKFLLNYDCFPFSTISSSIIQFETEIDDWPNNAFLQSNWSFSRVFFSIVFFSFFSIQIFPF